MRRAPVMLCLATLAGCPPAGTGGGTGDAGTTDTPNVSTPELSTTGVDPSAGDGPTTGGGPTPTTGGGPGTTSGAATSDGMTSTGGTTGGIDTGEGWTPKGCPEIYAQDILPTFELELGAKEMAAIKEEWVIADDEDLDEHPLKSFRYEDTVITDASIRLRGNSSHWPDQGKMQFEVSFNTYDKKGRFKGLKHVLFDAAEYNRSYMRDRLALAILRDVGLPAPCANNARLILNGEYYGLFTSIEKVDSEFIERYFEDDGGNLYKRGGGGSGWQRKNNEEDPDEGDIERLGDAKSVADLLAVMNLEEAILEWAAEAVIPDRDGAWAGGLNLYVYNDPKTGFNVIPWDLDDSFTRLEPDIDPVVWKKPADVFHGRPFYDIALADPVWFERYIAAVEFVLETGYDVTVLQGRIDTWAAQIATAAAEDPNRPFTLEEHLDRVQEKREFVAARAAFLEQWLACWQNGGTKDSDGYCESA